MSDKKTNFANGFDYLCPDCGVFFNIQTEENVDVVEYADYCPFCSEPCTVCTVEGILEYCAEYGIDPVKFYKAFAQDEMIPNSVTGATPGQVVTIIGEHKMRKRRNVEASPEIITYFTRIQINIVRKVFEELLVTEKGETP